MPDHVQGYLDARIEGATDLAGVYQLYQRAPDCFSAGVQYALDKMLSRMVGSTDIYGISQAMHAHAIDILNNTKDRRL